MLSTAAFCLITLHLGPTAQKTSVPLPGILIDHELSAQHPYDLLPDSNHSHKYLPFEEETLCVAKRQSNNTAIHFIMS